MHKLNKMTAEEFIENYRRLQLVTPHLALNNTKSVNSEYCTWAINNKNCYMCYAADHNEDCMWCRWLYFAKDCTDCSFMHNGTLCYECLDSNGCYNCDFCQNCDNCSDCQYCYDCVGCTKCIGCAGLRRQEYRIFNNQYSKEQFEVEAQKLKEEITKNPSRFLQMFEDIRLRTPRKAVHSFKSENCTGDYIRNSKNSHDCYDINDCEDCGHLYDIFALEDAQLCYEGVSNWGYNMNFCTMCWFSTNMEYCEMCQSCKDCFGCISLKGNQYCILNRQHEKDEYEKLVQQIKSDLKAKNLYNRWFPESPFKVEDTLAADVNS
jgi:hypothetical protein